MLGIATQLHDDQVDTACRIWGSQGEVILAELDDCPRVRALRKLAADLREVGGEQPQEASEPTLRLVPPPGTAAT